LYLRALKSNFKKGVWNICKGSHLASKCFSLREQPFQWQKYEIDTPGIVRRLGQCSLLMWLPKRDRLVNDSPHFSHLKKASDNKVLLIIEAKCFVIFFRF
jgi:hypothetical protein